MGYTLKIGEAVLEWTESRVVVDCEVIHRDDAPAHGEPTDHESQRWPSYSGWSEAMEKLGLMDVMFCRRNGGAGSFEWNGRERYPLLQSHPGCMPITQEHLEYIECKLSQYRETYPDHVAQYPPLIEGAEPVVPGASFYDESQYVKDPRFDAALVRGEWLLYWIKYAVENLKQPVFVNS